MVEISSPERVIFPDAGLKKRDVVEHYLRVGDKMLLHVRGRPLTLERFPKGIGAKGFMQKNAGEHFPAFIRRIPVQHHHRVTHYPAVDTVEGLAYLANQGTVTFHVWTSREPDLGRADRVVFDLDPPEGGFEGARRAAQRVRELLAELELPCSPVATGAKGYHVVTVIEPRHDGPLVAKFTRNVSALLTMRYPDALTSEFRKSKRKGRVFVDWLRNQGGATVVAPWSLRPRPQAPVAVPIRWSEIEDTPPDRFTLRTVAERLDVDDPITLARAVDASAAIERAQQLADAAGIVHEPFDRFRD